MHEENHSREPLLNCITMKPNFSSFGLSENGSVEIFFPQTTSYVEENEKEFSSLRITRKCLLSRRNGKRQPANVANGGKIMVT